MTIGYLAIILAGLLGFVIGFVWYLPQVFGKPWMKATGIVMTPGAKPKGMAWRMFVSLLGTFLTAYVLAELMRALYIFKGNYTGVPMDPAMVGLLTGGLVWLGFLATSLVDPVLWQNKPWSLWLVNAGYWLVKLLAMGALIGFMS